MSELKLQRDVVTAVNAMGGKAHKLSNRFLIGVADLLIKLPSKHPAMVMEVKKNKLAKLTPRSITLDVSKLQEKFLCDYAAAGMPAGIISFIQTRGALWVRLFPIAEVMASDYRVLTAGYTSIPIGQRGTVIFELLTHFAQSYEPIGGG